ncbi:MAG: NADAR family protein, partial [Halieaceae bacterium]|nr:NADAR family protein [Halieaceae bacterium]
MEAEPGRGRDALYLSRTDANEPLSAYSRHGFFLDDAQWPSVEHYFQAMKSLDGDWRERVRMAPHPRQARRLGRSRRAGLRKDWKQVRRVVMTRAVYIKCRTHAEVAQRLLATGAARLVESNAYDYFWGCGRDRRGLNVYGEV